MELPAMEMTTKDRKKAALEEKRAMALKANLKRRKDQSKAREAEDEQKDKGNAT